MAAFELSLSFTILLNFHHSSYHTKCTSMLSPVCLQQRKILHCYVMFSRLLQKGQVQNKFSLIPTYLCSNASETSPCLDWAPADEKQPLNHVALYGFSWLNMTLSGQKMVRKIYKLNHPHSVRKEKERKLARKLNPVYAHFALSIL